MPNTEERSQAQQLSTPPESLESAFAQLDEILERLEDRELPLEDAFAQYQQGMNLLKLCNEKIDTVEKKIQIMNGDGTLDEFR